MKSAIITLFTFTLLNLYAQTGQAQDYTTVGQHTIVCVERQASALKDAGYTITVISRNNGLKTHLEEKMLMLSSELAIISEKLQDNILREVGLRLGAGTALQMGFWFMGEYYEELDKATDLDIPAHAPTATVAAPDLRQNMNTIPSDDMLIPDNLLRKGQFRFMNVVYDAAPAETDLFIPGF